MSERAVLYRGFMVLVNPDRGMRAYRSPLYYKGDMVTYEVPLNEDISNKIDEMDDRGEFTEETLREVAGDRADFPEVDICVGCGDEFDVHELYYEGVEPVVFAPRCRVCLIKQAQDIAGKENVDLGPSWNN